MGRPVAQLPPPRQRDPGLIATGSWDDTSRLWNLHSHLSTVLNGHVGHVNSVAFRPDGKAVATASSDGIDRLWGTIAQSATKALTGHSDYVDTAAAFGSNGHTLARGGSRLWPSARTATCATWPCENAVEAGQVSRVTE